jgi:hypothetical protein
MGQAATLVGSTWICTNNRLFQKARNELHYDVVLLPSEINWTVTLNFKKMTNEKSTITRLFELAVKRMHAASLLYSSKLFLERISGLGQAATLVGSTWICTNQRLFRKATNETKQDVVLLQSEIN